MLSHLVYLGRSLVQKFCRFKRKSVLHRAIQLIFHHSKKRKMRFNIMTAMYDTSKKESPTCLSLIFFFSFCIPKARGTRKKMSDFLGFYANHAPEVYIPFGHLTG